MAEYRLRLPLRQEDIDRLRAGDRVYLTGTLYTGRDAAHKRMIEGLAAGKELPVDLRGETIYYVGPTPARPGRPIGSAGPTTSGRMDPYTPQLLERGLKGIIGKGGRSRAVRDALVRHRAVYFAAVGGAGALIARSVRSAKVVAYEDLGPEAIHCLEVEDFPVVVVNDMEGGDLYEQGVAQYRRA